jgi:hypothetical protein
MAMTLSVRSSIWLRVAGATSMSRFVVRHPAPPLRGQKAVVRVVGRVQQVLVIELAEDDGRQHVIPSHRIVGMLSRHLLVDLQGRIEVQVVEVLKRLPDQRIEVQRIGVQVGLRQRAAGTQQQDRHHQPPAHT